MITGKTLVNYIYFYKIKSGEKSFQKSNLLPSNIFKGVGYIIHSSGSCRIHHTFFWFMLHFLKNFYDQQIAQYQRHYTANITHVAMLQGVQRNMTETRRLGGRI